MNIQLRNFPLLKTGGLNYLLILILFISCEFTSNRNSSQSSEPETLVKEDTLKSGEKLFLANCSSCHFICKQSIGPALAGINKRRDRDWLLKFIRNSQQVIGSGDAYAQHLFDNFNSAVMPNFENLSDEEIIRILKFIDIETIEKLDAPDTAKPPPADQNIRIENPREKKNYYEISTALRYPESSANVVKGKQLFLNHCETCHEICSEKIGPPLANVTFRRPLPWLIDFIRDPKEVLETGDNYALYLTTQYNEVMVPTYLKDSQILDILSYIRHESGSPIHVSGVNSPETYHGSPDP
jgi:cytochrome c2